MSMMQMARQALRCGGTALVLALASSGCSADSADLTIAIWGEEYIEQQIPADQFEDGWTITYDKFLIVIGRVEVGDTQGELSSASSDVDRVFDLVSPGPQQVVTFSLPTATYDDVGYTLAPATASTSGAASVSGADLAEMKAAGYTLYAAGVAQKGVESMAFSWGFSPFVHYARCVDVNASQQLQGVVIADEGAAIQLTIHGDHLFYDDLLSTDAKLRFDIMAAADANMDGELTLAELAAVPLADIPPDKGSYSSGASDANDLKAYVTAATRTVGHFNGEGHCEVSGD